MYFYAAAGVEDSPTQANISLRGLQTVGEDNSGTGFAVDIAGNAYSFTIMLHILLLTGQSSRQMLKEINGMMDNCLRLLQIMEG